MKNYFGYFISTLDLSRLTVVLYACYPLSLRQVEDILFERDIDICQEAVRLRWNRLGPILPPKSGKVVLSIDAFRNGVGLRVQFLSALMARCFTSGAWSIMKA